MPTLVDTSVWIEHFRSGSQNLQRLLEQDQVLCHPLIIGEIACGHLNQRTEVLHSLMALPQAPSLEFHEALTFLELRKLFGQGLGWIDVQLLAAARLAGASLWTFDGALHRAAHKLQVPVVPAD